MPKERKVEKLSVSLPQEIASEMRALVPQGKLSAFFTEAVQRYLTYRRQKAALEKGFGAWKTENHPDLKTPEDSTSYVRALREADKKRLARLGAVVEYGQVQPIACLVDTDIAIDFLRQREYARKLLGSWAREGFLAVSVLSHGSVSQACTILFRLSMKFSL